MTAYFMTLVAACFHERIHATHDGCLILICDNRLKICHFPLLNNRWFLSG